MTAPYECWAWVESEESGQEGVVAARVDLPGAGATALPLQNRCRDLVVNGLICVLAAQHARRTGRSVRLVHLVETTEEERGSHL